MREIPNDLEDLHWLMGLLLSIDAGILVVDRDFRIRTWNGFLINHTGTRPEKVLGLSLFEVFPEIDQVWLRNKSRPVFELRCRVFLTWQQRPYLVRFHNYRTITGMSDHMYQNVTMIPLPAPDGEVRHMGMLIYDVTETAEAQGSPHPPAAGQPPPA